MTTIKEKLQELEKYKQDRIELVYIINDYTKEKKIKWKDIWDILGISSDTVSRIKNDENFSISHQKVKEYLSKLKA